MTGRALLIAALVALALPGTALADGRIVVAPDGEAEKAVTLSALAGKYDVRDRPYRGPDGKPVRITGISLDAVLRATGVDPFGFDRAEVTAGGATVPVQRSEIVTGSEFPDGPAVFSEDAGGAFFLLPAATDGRAARRAGAPELRVRMVRTSDIELTARASRSRVNRGDAVTFSASAKGGSGTIAYSWTFDDGGHGRGARVTHRFKEPGTYDVVVGATTAGDPRGTDAIVTVTVGKPANGPDRKGGGTDSDAAAPDSGAASGGGGTAAPPARRAPRRAPKRRAAARGDRVEGVLLADASPSAAERAARAARTGRVKPAAAESGGFGVPPGVWGGLAALTLLFLGGWRERRGPSSKPAPLTSP